MNFRVDYRRIKEELKSLSSKKNMVKIIATTKRPLSPGIRKHNQRSDKFSWINHVHKASPGLRRDGHA